jgi:hypothetical protein
MIEYPALAVRVEHEGKIGLTVLFSFHGAPVCFIQSPGCEVNRHHVCSSGTFDV